MKSKIKNNSKPLIIFFGIAFTIAWLLMGIGVASNYGLFTINFPFEPFIIIGSWVPNLAAFIVLAWIIKRKGGINQLFKGWLKFKVAPIWYIIILSPIFFAFITIGIYGLVYGYYPTTEVFTDPLALVAIIIMSTITGAMGEELGWRGFALPWLQTRYNALTSSIILGTLWSVWHLPLWFTGIGFETIPFWAYAIIGISFTIMLTWICNSTRGSLVMATLFHLTLNISVNMIESEALTVQSIVFLSFAFLVVLVYGYKTLSKADTLPIDYKTKTWIE